MSDSQSDNAPMLSCLARGGRAAALFAPLALLGACSPTLDWREVRPEATEAVALFPCKPSTDVRTVSLDGDRVRMRLVACRAGDATWALAYAEVADPARVAPALTALRAAAQANLGGAAERLGPMQVQGMTPNPLAERLRLQGKLPSGEPVTQELGFFSRGTWVFQATVMGAKLGSEPVANFFDSIKWPS
ncbi:hypothetical protein ACVNIS_02510 [Sphaerotilaceae bacterium SBD11-9]